MNGVDSSTPVTSGTRAVDGCSGSSSVCPSLPHLVLYGRAVLEIYGNLIPQILGNPVNLTLPLTEH